MPLAGRVIELLHVVGDRFDGLGFEIEIVVRHQILRPIHTHKVAFVPRAIGGVLVANVELLACSRVVLEGDVEVALNSEGGHDLALVVFTQPLQGVRSLDELGLTPSVEEVFLNIPSDARHAREVGGTNEGEPVTCGDTNHGSLIKELAIETALHQGIGLDPVNRWSFFRTPTQHCHCERENQDQPLRLRELHRSTSL